MLMCKVNLKFKKKMLYHESNAFWLLFTDVTNNHSLSFSLNMGYDWFTFAVRHVTSFTVLHCPSYSRTTCCINCIETWCQWCALCVFWRTVQFNVCVPNYIFYIYKNIYNIVNVELFVLNLIVFIDNIHLSTCLSRYDVYVEFAQEMTTLSIIIIIKK